MPNILRRPMFRLGGQSSDGVGITSGLNRKNYNTGSSEYISQMEELWPSIQSGYENLGKVSTPRLALTLSDVIRQGGSISDMVGNMTSAVLPMADRYEQMQSLMPMKKFEGLGTMAGLKIKQETAARPLEKDRALQMSRQADEMKRVAEAEYGKGKVPLNIQDEYESLKIIALGNAFMSTSQAYAKALEIIGKVEGEIDEDDKERLSNIVGVLTGQRWTGKTGGRVGLQNSFPGTVEEASMAEQIQTPGGVEDITENEEVIAEGQEGVPPGGPKQDPFVILRARLPQEITDDVVKLIAYNPDAFKDFAAIETQQDVINFNETYGVELVLPTEQV